MTARFTLRDVAPVYWEHHTVPIFGYSVDEARPLRELEQATARHWLDRQARFAPERPYRCARPMEPRMEPWKVILLDFVGGVVLWCALAAVLFWAFGGERSY